MATPLITASMLLAAPASISWTVVPTLTASFQQNAAQLGAVCWRATSYVDTYCHQPLRAAVHTDTLTGPGAARVAVDRNTGTGTLLARYGPVTGVAAVQVSSARAFPPAWALVPAGQYSVREPVDFSELATGPSGSNVVDVAPGYIRWAHGRAGQKILLSTVSGWPHTSLTASAGEGDGTLAVDDVTGWAGCAGYIYDGLVPETAEVTAVSAASPKQLPGVAGTVQSGPGTLTLASPLSGQHPIGTVISAVPGNVIHAGILAATVEALETIDAIATQSLSGQMAGGTGILAEQCELLLDEFCRVA